MARKPPVHGSNTTYVNGCRCELCVTQRATRSKAARLKRINETPFEKIPHGRKGYGLYMCRCDICKLDGALEAHERREAMTLRNNIPHGTLTGYSNYKCRCEDCKTARKEFKRIYDLRSRYGLSLEDYENLLRVQDFKCAICKVDVTQGGCVDHSHATDEVRGVLCGECNFGLGHARDSTAILNIAIEYLVARSPATDRMEIDLM